MSSEVKQQLFVGEGNFSFTEAYLDKHGKQVASSITATELKTRLELDEETLNRIKRLKNLGVTIILGFDATNSSDLQKIKLPIPCIRWNMPHDGKSYKGQTIPKMLIQFLNACRSVQNCENRVYITLKQSNQQLSKRRREASYSATSQGYEYDIVKVATSGGYRLVKKKSFAYEGDNRYPRYEFEVTCDKAKRIHHNAQTFVFEKVPDSNYKKADEPIRYDSDTIKRVHGPMAQKVEPVDCRRDGIVYRRKFYNITTEHAATTNLEYVENSDSDGIKDEHLSQDIFIEDWYHLVGSEQKDHSQFRRIEDERLLEYNERVNKAKKRCMQTQSHDDAVELVNEAVLRSTIKAVRQRELFG